MPELSRIDVRYDFVGVSYVNSVFIDFGVNDSLLFNTKVSRSNSGYGIKARSVSGDKRLNKVFFKDKKVLLNIGLDNQGDVNATGYIDYYSYQYETKANSIPSGEPFYVIRSQKVILSDDGGNKIMWVNSLTNRAQYIIPETQELDSLVYYFGDDTLQVIFQDLLYLLFLNI